MHIGSLRVALFNYICAKQSCDMLIVCIESKELEADRENSKENRLYMKMDFYWLNSLISGFTWKSILPPLILSPLISKGNCWLYHR